MQQWSFVLLCPMLDEGGIWYFRFSFGESSCTPKLCGCGQATCLLWVLTASLRKEGNSPRWRSQLLWASLLSPYTLLRLQLFCHLSKGGSWNLLFLQVSSFPFQESVELSSDWKLALSLEWYKESFHMFHPEWCVTNVHDSKKKKKVCALLFFRLEIAKIFQIIERN